VRIFSHIIILFFYSLTNAQSDDLEVFNKLTQSGRWGDYYVLDSNNQFQLIKEDVKVDSVHFIGDKSIKLLALKKLFNNLTNSSSSRIAISSFKDIQDAHTFISNNSNLSFARYNQNNIAAVVDIKTDFKSHIGGILGSSKDNKEEWKLNGEIDFNLENVFKNASSFRLLWRQPKPSFRFLSFEINSPFILNMPFGVSAKAMQEFSNQNYLYEAFTIFFTAIGPYGRWKIGSKFKSTTDFQVSEHSNSRAAAFAVEGDRRNARWLPYSGSNWGADIDIGNNIYEATNSLELNTAAHFGIYKQVFSKTFLFKIQGYYNQINGRKLNAAKRVKFGGSSTLRGYNENQFSADWVTLQTFEWISGDLDRSQFFVFFDQVFAKDLNIKPSSGFGLRVFNGTFYYDISLGFPIEGIGDGKIHIKFNTQL
tara:strand:+ start:24853 stop:26121 length:1269 start_codon:yes stop_codon:yes gene_type:complete